MKTTKYLMVMFATLIFFISGCANQTQQTTTTTRLAVETTTTMEMPATTTTSQAITSTTTRPSTTTPTAPGKTQELTLTAKNMAFDQKTITVTAGAHIKMLFKNQDANVPHNFALYDSSEAKTNYFKGQIIRGVAETTYEFDAPATLGTYFFRCDPHAQIMNGDFIVQSTTTSTTPTQQTSTTIPLVAKTINIDISGFAFKPNTLTINKGDTVVWTNKDSAPHTVTSDSGNELNSKTLPRDDTYSHTFGTAGTFSYHCNIHPSMKGTITAE